MARGKAQFSGAQKREMQGWRFSESVRGKIRALYPGLNADPGTEECELRKQIAREEWGQDSDEVPTPADCFVDDIERAARWAFFAIARVDSEGGKQDILAELKSLLNRSRSLRDDFRKLSPSVDRLLFLRDPLEYADNLDRACNDLEKAYATAETLSKKAHTLAGGHKIAVELAIRTLRVAKQAGMKISATADPDMGYFSDAVKLLSYIGKDIGMGLAVELSTWKNIIIEARKDASDLK